MGGGEGGGGGEMGGRWGGGGEEKGGEGTGYSMNHGAVVRLGGFTLLQHTARLRQASAQFFRAFLAGLRADRARENPVARGVVERSGPYFHVFISNVEAGEVRNWCRASSCFPPQDVNVVYHVHYAEENVSGALRVRIAGSTNLARIERPHLRSASRAASGFV